MCLTVYIYFIWLLIVLSARCFVPSCFNVYPEVLVYSVFRLCTVYCICRKLGTHSSVKVAKFSKNFHLKLLKLDKVWEIQRQQKNVYSQFVWRSIFGRWNHLLIVDFYNQHVAGLNVGRSFPWNNHWQAIGARWAILRSLQKEKVMFVDLVILQVCLKCLNLNFQHNFMVSNGNLRKFYDTLKTRNEIVKTAKPIKLNNCKKNMLRCLIYVLCCEGSANRYYF